MLKIGLTGGIGSGKSTAAQYFTELSIEVIDADVIAHELIIFGTTTYQAIIAKFSSEILTTTKTIDRNQLRNIIFNNPDDKKWLENLLHPIIIKEMQRRIKQVKSSYCILVIPLLFETNLQRLVDRILVIEAPIEQQIKRTMARGLTEKEAKAIIATQVDRAQRLSEADDIIHNDKTLAELKQQVKELHKQYISHGF